MKASVEEVSVEHGEWARTQKYASADFLDVLRMLLYRLFCLTEDKKMKTIPACLGSGMKKKKKKMRRLHQMHCRLL